MAGLAAAALAAGLAGVGIARLRPADPLAPGRAAYEREDWPGAAEVARARLKQAPDDPGALRLLARASARLGRDETAQAIFQRLGAGGASAEDFYLLATTLRRQDQDGTAMRMLERAEEIDPNHPETLESLIALYQPNDLVLAATPRARKLAAVPGWEARGHWLLGRLLLEEFDPAGAASSFAESLRRAPDARGLGTSLASARTLFARALLQAGRAAEARPVLQAALREGSNPEAAWLLSRAHLQEGAAAEALAALERAGDYGDDDPLAFEPAPYVGSARCATCHAAIHRTQQSGRHAHSFARDDELGRLPLPGGPVADPRDPRIIHTFTRAGGQVRVTTRFEEQTLSALVEFAFGSGHRAITLVVDDDEWGGREFRLSHYAAPGVGWDLTLHHPDHPRSAADAVGQPIIPDHIRNCLHCHLTDYRVADDRTRPESADRGIGCERCHGPGGNHLKAVALDFSDPAIARPELGTAAQRVALCGQCHKAPGGIAETSTEFVRFQAPNLVKSRCYTESDGALDCTTCHNPHRNAESSYAFYEAKCLECHAQPTRRSCPVNPAQGCIGCHMPVEAEAVPHTPFTDHYIRVHRGSGKNRTVARPGATP